MDDNKNNVEERRAPLGGISKPSFMAVAEHSVGEDFAGMLYDMLRDIKSCQIRQGRKCDTCYEDFDKKYLRKIHKKIPLSWPEFIAVLLVVGGMIALGIIDAGTLVKFLKLWI